MAAEIKVEKGIPLPPVRRGPGSKYPWDKLEIGDSFVVATAKLKGFYPTIAKANMLRAPKHFCARTVNEGGRDVVRVWRDADRPVKPGAETTPEGGKTLGG